MCALVTGVQTCALPIWDARDLSHHRLDVLYGDGLLALRLRQQALRSADLVDHVDRLVGELAVADIACREFHRSADRVIRSEEGRVGKECVSTVRFRWCADH